MLRKGSKMLMLKIADQFADIEIQYSDEMIKFFEENLAFPMV